MIASYLSFFSEHMHAVGDQEMNRIDDHGVPTAETAGLERIPSASRNRSDVMDIPFFSLPFRRRAWYEGDGSWDRHKRKRTIFRHYDGDSSTVEERTTGVVHPTASGRSKVGRFAVL